MFPENYNDLTLLENGLCVKKDQFVHLRGLVSEIGKYVEGKWSHEDFDASKVDSSSAVIETKSENKEALFDDLELLTEDVPDSVREKVPKAREARRSGGSKQRTEKRLESRGKETLEPDFFGARPVELEDPYFWDGEETTFEISAEEVSSLEKDLEQIRGWTDELRADESKEYDSFMYRGDPPESQRLSVAYRGVIASHNGGKGELSDEKRDEIEEITGFDSPQEFRSHIHQVNREARKIPLRDVPGSGTSLREYYADIVAYGSEADESEFIKSEENGYVVFDTEDWLESYQVGTGSSVSNLFHSGYIGLTGKNKGDTVSEADAVVLDYEGVMEVVDTAYGEAHEGDVSGVAD